MCLGFCSLCLKPLGVRQVFTPIGIFCEDCGAFDYEILKEKYVTHKMKYEEVKLMYDGEKWKEVKNEI